MASDVHFTDRQSQSYAGLVGEKGFAESLTEYPVMRLCPWQKPRRPDFSCPHYDGGIWEESSITDVLPEFPESRFSLTHVPYHRLALSKSSIDIRQGKG